MTDKKDSKIIIEGITEDGKVFRPSDWAERVSGSLSTFRNHRIYYSDLLKPSIQNETPCVILDKALKESNPVLYEHILQFAHNNKLKICGEETTSTEVTPVPKTPPDPNIPSDPEEKKS